MRRPTLSVVFLMVNENVKDFYPQNSPVCRRVHCYFTTWLMISSYNLNSTICTCGWRMLNVLYILLNFVRVGDVAEYATQPLAVCKEFVSIVIFFVSNHFTKYTASTTWVKRTLKTRPSQLKNFHFWNMLFIG